MNRALANENLTISVQPLGRSREPLLIIDDFPADPAALVAAALRAPDWAEVAPGGYPGQRAALPGPYARAVLRRLDPIIRARLMPGGHRLARFECAFSRITRPPDALTALQKLPHIDIARGSRVAILHYLCGPPHGGTAFFRQDSTGLEQVGAADKARYLAARAADLAALDGAAGFADADTPGYTETGRVAARMGRLVIYRSFTLHSGVITAASHAPEPGAIGRLTANFFVDYAARP